MLVFSDQELLSAYRVLFGPDATLNRGFLWYLQPTGVKTAYRERAKESHPDAHPLADASLLEVLRTQFNEINLAYKLLDSYLHQRRNGQQNGYYETGDELLQMGNDSSDHLQGRSLPRWSSRLEDIFTCGCHFSRAFPHLKP
jgi:curved DNA-binding protein CbpA